MPEGCRRSDANGLCNPVDRLVCRLQSLLRREQSLVGDPLMGRRADFGLKMSGERPRRHVRLLRERRDAEAAVEIGLRPFEQPRQAASRVRLHRGRHVLRLIAFSMRRHDEPPGNLIGHDRAKVVPNDVETEIDTGGAACRREDTAFVDVEYVRFDEHPGKSCRQSFCIAPVCGRPFPIEQSGRCENERTRTNRHEARTAAIRALERGQENRRRPLVSVSPARDDDGVRLPQRTETAARMNGDTANRPHRTAFK